MMRGLRLVASPGYKITVEECNVPDPGADQILVRVTRSHMSVGTEMNFYRLNPPESQHPPMPLGYMTVGYVETVGSGVVDYEPGDRVLTCGHHGNYWLVDLRDTGPMNWYISRLDDAVSDNVGGFAILGDVALHGVRRAELQIDESVAVFGLGMVGQLTVQFARLSGAHPIIAVDLYDARLQKARSSGATHTVNAAVADPVPAIREITEGMGAETLFHCASAPQILQTMMKAAADRGAIVLTGSPPGTAEIGLQEELLRRELTIIANYEFGLTQPHPYWPWTRQRNRRACLRLLAAGELQLDHLITHIVPYTQAQEMVNMMARGGDDWLGVVFKWDE